MSTTSAPSSTAEVAVTRPPTPAPMTRISQSTVSVDLALVDGRGRNLEVPLRVRELLGVQDELAVAAGAGQRAGLLGRAAGKADGARGHSGGAGHARALQEAASIHVRVRHWDSLLVSSPYDGVRPHCAAAKPAARPAVRTMDTGRGAKSPYGCRRSGRAHSLWAKFGRSPRRARPSHSKGVMDGGRPPLY